jgi:hypothetical protein
MFDRIPLTAAAPSISNPASRNRAVSSSSGGQSAIANLATEKAELQSRQNAATISGSGIESAKAGEAAVGAAARMEVSFG